MSKKNKTKAIDYFDSSNHLYDLRKSIDEKYNLLLDEIAFNQYKIYKAERKARKKQKKKNKNREYGFVIDNNRLKVREKIIKDAAADGGLFDRLIEALKTIKPAIQAFATVVSQFICLLLSVNAVKTKISPNMLSKVNLVYQVCTNM